MQENCNLYNKSTVLRIAVYDNGYYCLQYYSGRARVLLYYTIITQRIILPMPGVDDDSLSVKSCWCCSLFRFSAFTHPAMVFTVTMGVAMADIRRQKQYTTEGTQQYHFTINARHGCGGMISISNDYPGIFFFFFPRHHPKREEKRAEKWCLW